MSSLSGIPAPSTALLRYLRHQSKSLSHCNLRPDKTVTRSCNVLVKQPPTRRCLSSSTRQCYGNRTSRPSYIQDLFARNRDKCKALPAPISHPASNHLSATRHASSDTSPTRYEKPSLWQRIFHRGRIREQQKHVDQNNKPLPDYSFSAIGAGGSYEETSAQLFNLSRALHRSPAGTELKLRCTEFDSDGKVTLVSGEFKKSELIAKYGLLPRDLRKIDSSVLPHILVRSTAILLNLLHLRVLIQNDRVLVFDAYGSTDSYTQSLFMYDLEGKLRQKTGTVDGTSRDGSNYLPYEFRALEAVLISVTSGLEAEFALVREPVTHILRALEEDIDREKLRHLLIHSKKLGTFEQKARLVRDALNELLEADDDLASMYLTERKKTGKPRAETDHTEVEMLLESYHKICDEVVEISGNLISNIRNTEEVVKAILDANRNQLMLFEIKVSVATLGLAGGTLVAGFYGMNLENFIEDTNWGFGAVTGFSVAFSAWLCIYGLRKLRKVQKVRMWGEGGIDPYNPGLTTGQQGAAYRSLREGLRENRGNWQSEALQALALGEERKRKMNARSGVVSKSTVNIGPVLWPGMEGLGLHKLPSNSSTDAASEVEDTNSDADAEVVDFQKKKQPLIRIKDDTAIGLKEKK